MGALRVPTPGGSFNFCEGCAPRVMALVDEVRKGYELNRENNGAPRGHRETSVPPPAELGRAWRALTQLWRLAHTDTVSDKYDNRDHRRVAATQWTAVLTRLNIAEGALDFTAWPRPKRRNSGKLEITIGGKDGA